MDRSRPQFSVLGLPVHILDDYAGWLIERLHQGLGSHVVTLNAEMAMQAEQNPALADVIRSAELVIPDGSGVVLYLRMRGKSAQRFPGIELAESLLQQGGTLPNSEPIFFFGGAPGVTAKAAESWQQKVNGLSISSQHGYLSADEETEFCESLKQMQPKIIFVGLGVPRQEFWIAKNRHLCPQSIWVGVGGSFDIWAGTKDRAPAWFCDNHLEWLYRLYQEPWRWRRMLALPQFALKALGDLRA
ncbi:MAG: WecB/TagA/CpsF family glycosyltransferase [Microcoleus sp. PH2017_10_PVI_O_A]|uniref:WecB/TagA/CpsF family glycosyltransferase n=1 Tax=unclassified Microcoleus TaxID=2642155 RepID=UPI001D2A1DFA|nr:MULTISPECIES: WecB/TagA/CpsF family glycosyltransferase [unclassified Microcoleus]TAE85545.1 MAG: glycosyltransferase [Oscillatoriales cyanobacterium]MCC3404629.1 WecB/TagA/CpsF family glycosyltransferase [Microcoleus sp. PH2017_10_PVI_O_A]MCC3458655.1 WecB/TagA/CpsF family glycosyltransferase [Microcoleus sp. PH2017_11_PCY_U_A]MCC3476921.1 WecB/TagA/CpsF family glycosyltransferase [Microcoleus sp. PH2017_12_PCY_D_A]MCC3526512.1 WecB/TagA/CpsF family glycosyltransferase [Microcoleus sp. PH2